MIGTVLEELKAAATASLGSQIQAVAARRGVALVSTFTIYDWWQEEAQQLKLSFPALAVTWQRTRTGLRRSQVGHRHAEHDLVLAYGIRSATMEEIRRHMLYVPEAILQWLDQFPIASRSAGATITKVQPPTGDGIQITHTIEAVHEGGLFLWTADVGLTVEAVDA